MSKDQPVLQNDDDEMIHENESTIGTENGPLSSEEFSSMFEELSSSLSAQHLNQEEKREVFDKYTSRLLYSPNTQQSLEYFEKNVLPFYDGARHSIDLSDGNVLLHISVRTSLQLRWFDQNNKLQMFTVKILHKETLSSIGADEKTIITGLANNEKFVSLTFNNIPPVLVCSSYFENLVQKTPPKDTTIEINPNELQVFSTLPVIKRISFTDKNAYFISLDDNKLFHKYCNDDDAAPVEIPLAEGDYVRVLESGGNHAICITNTGKIFAHGDNSKGQCGLDPQEHPYISTFYEITNLFGFDSTTAEIGIYAACGNQHSCILTSVKKLYTFGDNSKGQLGRQNIDQVNYDHIPKVVTTLQNVDQVVANADYTACRISEITQQPENINSSVVKKVFNYMHTRTKIMTFGCNLQGQLGTGLDTLGFNVKEPREVILSFGNSTEFYVGKLTALKQVLLVESQGFDCYFAGRKFFISTSKKDTKQNFFSCVKPTDAAFRSFVIINQQFSFMTND
jgi:hypothetical protein